MSSRTYDSTVTCPGLVTEIKPPQEQLHFESLVMQGWLPIVTIGFPGVQGAAVTGIHGTGVNTPNAAAVAAATIGLDTELHIPNGSIFKKGT